MQARYIQLSPVLFLKKVTCSNGGAARRSEERRWRTWHPVESNLGADPLKRARAFDFKAHLAGIDLDSLATPVCRFISPIPFDSKTRLFCTLALPQIRSVSLQPAGDAG